MNDDLISRQAAIDALWKALCEYEDKTEKQFQESDELDVGDWILHRIFVQNMSDIDRRTILELPPAQPEERTEKHTGTHACDLIDRQAAIDALKEERCPCESDYDEGYLSMLDKAIWIMQEWLPPAQPEQNWIPCTEQLPRQGQEVICRCRADMIKVLKLDAYGDWYQDATHCYMGGFVIAWMPLPEPYKEGGADVR